MDSKEKNFVSAIIYVRNCESRVGDFLKTVIEVFEKNFEHSEIICVNDGSTDDSLEVIRETSSLASCTSISVVNMSFFHGLELSMNAGMDLAIGDFVFEFDNTILDFDSDQIMNVYRKSLEGNDIVAASVDQKEKLSSKLFYHLFARFSNLKHRMNTESFRILSRRAINRVNSMSKSIPYRKALYANCGLKTDRIVYARKAQFGEEKIIQDKSYRKDLAVDSLIMFTDIGFRFSLGMTTLMMVFLLCTIIYSIAVFLISTPISGWTSTMLFLSVVFLGLFGILTVIIKYLQILIDLIFRRKRYTFESIEKITKY